MRRAVIIDAVRSPFGKGRAGGALAAVHPVDLYAEVLKALVIRADIDPMLVEDVITGCVLQVGEQSGNIARQAALAAGFPESVPGVTLDRKCGSAQQALDFAAQGVIAGAYDVVIAGGVEMMSAIPMRANRIGRDNEGPLHHARYPEGLVRQGISAELIAARYGIDRAAQDAFALASHKRAAKAADETRRAVREIVPIRVPQPDGSIRLVRDDEGIRRDTSLERLAALEPAFASESAAERFPELTSWSVTAGNASQVSDGASAVLIMSEERARTLDLTPRAAITHFAVTGDDPVIMLTGVIPATRKLLARANLSVNDLSAIEVNEAFASVVLAWAKTFEVDPDRINARGGAIALGHPVGASGGRLTAAILATLESTGGRYGLQTMCESGGMANATLFERLS